MRSQLLFAVLLATTVLAAPVQDQPSTSTGVSGRAKNYWQLSPAMINPKQIKEAKDRRAAMDRAARERAAMDRAAKDRAAEEVLVAQNAVQVPELSCEDEPAQESTIRKRQLELERQTKALAMFQNYNSHVELDSWITSLLVLRLDTVEDRVQPTLLKKEELVREAVQKARHVERLLFGTLGLENVLASQLELSKLKPAFGTEDTLLELVSKIKKVAEKNCDRDVKLSGLKDYNDDWKMDDHIAAILIAGGSVFTADFYIEMRQEARPILTENLSEILANPDMDFSEMLGPKVAQLIKIRGALLKAREEFPLDPSLTSQTDKDNAFAEKLIDLGATCKDVTTQARERITFELAVKNRWLYILEKIFGEDVTIANIPKIVVDNFIRLSKNDDDLTAVLARSKTI